MRYVTPFQVPSELKELFVSAFREWFPEPDGEIKIVSVSGGEAVIEGTVPIERKQEVIPFFDHFCLRFGLKYKIVDGGKVTEVNPAAV